MKPNQIRIMLKINGFNLIKIIFRNNKSSQKQKNVVKKVQSVGSFQGFQTMYFVRIYLGLFVNTHIHIIYAVQKQ